MEEIRRQIAEALAKHAYATVEMDPSPGLGFYFVCECEHRELKDGRMGKRDWLAKHQTEMLAPVIAEAEHAAVTKYAEREPATFNVEFTNQPIFDRAFREAQAEALREAADAYGPAQISGFFVSRDGYTKAWLRARADNVEAPNAHTD